MSTQAVSSSSIYQELQSFYQTRQSDLQALGSALQSGDLSTAQQVYNQIVSLGQTGPVSNGEPFYRSDRDSDFQAIGQALSSGDLASAQSAFATLEQTFSSSPASGPAQSAPAYTLHLSSTANAAATSTATPAQRHQFEHNRINRQFGIVGQPVDLPAASGLLVRSPNRYSAARSSAHRG